MARPNSALYKQVRSRFKTELPIPSPGFPGVYDGEHQESDYAKRQRLGDEEYTLLRQFEVYELRAAGVPLRQIAIDLGIGYQTMLNDLEAETVRRTAIVAGTHDAKVALSVTRYEAVITRALNRIAEYEEYRLKNGLLPNSNRCFLDEKILMEAQHRIDRVLGLHVRVPTDDSKTPSELANTTINVLIQTFANLPADARLQLLQRVREKMTAKPDEEAS